MMATWSAKETWVAGDWEITSMLKPWALPSCADFSKKSVAVLNTPVMSGGVQPITIFSSQRAGPAGASVTTGSSTVGVAAGWQPDNIRLNTANADSRTNNNLFLDIVFSP